MTFPTGDSAKNGYYWLAFHLLNYCTACTTCNSGYKKDYFPIRGKLGKPCSPPGDKLDADEQPFLIYPLGQGDDDPEEVIRFRGITAFAPEKDPLLPPAARTNVYRNRRATVVIELLALNTRAELLSGRAEKLRELEKSLAIMNHSKMEAKLKADAEQDIKQLCDGTREHTACVRGMIRLYQKDVATARIIFDAVRKYLATKTPETYFEHLRQFKAGGTPAL